MHRTMTIIAALAFAGAAFAEDAEILPDAAPSEAVEVLPSEMPMDMDRFARILLALDPELRTDGRVFELTVSDVPMTVVTDPDADRMRALIPIRSAEGMSRGELERVMQANFDTALDARYAVAQGRLWAVFIHPLSPLERDQLISGIGQLVNLALTYGTDYSGGLFTFGGGDSARIQRERIEDLLRRGRDI